jgi:hypothetical protein
VSGLSKANNDVDGKFWTDGGSEEMKVDDEDFDGTIVEAGFDEELISEAGFSSITDFR